MPISTAQMCVTKSGPAVMETSPASPPFRPTIRSIRPKNSRETDSAVITPAAAAKLVLISTTLIATASVAVPRASWDPPLKPNQPSHRMNTPSVTSTTLDGGVARTPPSLRNLPSLGPTTRMPARAAQPPVLWTMVEPAKSWNPIAASQPPPQVHAPTIG